MFFRNERGAVTVMTIFMMLFLVAMLYMVIGLGKTLVMKEGMQDAADAAAYSSAIFNARGMNLIVFINLIMAALVAVLVAIRVAQTLLFIASGIAAGLAWSSLGATGPLAAKLFQQGVKMGDHFSDAKRAIEPVLKGLHTTQEAVSVVVPWVAMTSGMSEAAVHHAPARGAFAIPGSISLPVETDEFSQLCGHATGTAADLAMMPIPGALLPGPVKKGVKRAAQGVGEKTSKFLCGDGSASPPTHTEKIKHQVPRHPQENECKTDNESSACKKIGRDRQLAQPDEDGDCQRQCGYDDPYESFARTARADCESTSVFQPHDYVWQKSRVVGDFLFIGGKWELTSRKIRWSTLETTYRSPCGFRGIVNEDEWHRDSGPRDADLPDAVCSDILGELDDTPEEGTTRTVEYDEATRVFSCAYEIEKTYSLGEKGDSIGGKGSEDKSPHRVEEDIALGDEVFQIRAVAFGAKPGPGKALEGVRVAVRGKGTAAPDSDVGGLMAGLGAELGRLSVAQSEYYFDHRGDVERDEWMWEMRWSARLKHFHLPDDDERQEQEQRQEKTAASVGDRVARFGGLQPDQSGQKSCQKQGGSKCAGAMQSLSLFDSIVRH